MIRRYADLEQLKSFDERFRYLMLNSSVGRSTFGFDRWLNQRFYASSEWKWARRFVIDRDRGCDLGIAGHEIHRDLMVHHMNPVTMDNIVNGDEWILDPEYLITTQHRTHNAIHFGDESLLPRSHVERRPGDTRLW